MAGGHKLIVAEKPSVGRDIARVVGATQRRNGFLEGPGVRVSWCVGHLAQLCEPHEYNPAWKSWSPTLLPMLPTQFRIRPSKHGARQLAVLGELLRDKTLRGIVNACDAGREGELIFRYVYELTNARAPVQRLWISSLTEQAIRAGLANMRPGHALDSLADAARCRAEADWLVGMNGTRALTALARRAGADALMSVGRVQTPTLALIVGRELAIEQFVSQPFWHVDATFAANAGSYVGRWHRGDSLDAKSAKGASRANGAKDAKAAKDASTRIASRADAEAIVAAVVDRQAQVAKATRRTVREQPPQLFDLTSLQKTANARFRLTAQQTLSTAQSLYETHKAITYPRTDSRHLTTDMVSGLAATVDSLATAYPELARAARERLAKPSVPGRRMVDDNSVGDHHAIIPTGKPVNASRLSASEARVFDLIARRFLAGLLPDAMFAKTRIETMVQRHLFVSEGRVCLDAGWQQAEPPARRNKQAPLLPAVEPGDVAQVSDVALHEGKTEPPKRYVDATLLGAMEHAHKTVDDAVLRKALRAKGMGTPATRAAIIENLIRRSYVDRVKHALQPTAHGRALIAVMPVEELLSAELTGAWEDKLAQVASGSLARASFMAELARFVGQAVETIAHADTSALATLRALPRQATSRGGATDTKRRTTTRTRQSATAKTTRTQQSAAAKTTRTRQSATAKTTRTRQSATATRQSAAAKTTRTQQSPATESAVAKPQQPPRCPACRKGSIIAGNRAWGCSRWKQSCNFVVAFVQQGVRLPADEADRLFRRGKTRLLAGLSATGKARLVLDLDTAGNIRIELGKRRTKRT